MAKLRGIMRRGADFLRLGIVVALFVVNWTITLTSLTSPWTKYAEPIATSVALVVVLWLLWEKWYGTTHLHPDNARNHLATLAESAMTLMAEGPESKWSKRPIRLLAHHPRLRKPWRKLTKAGSKCDAAKADVVRKALRVASVSGLDTPDLLSEILTRIATAAATLPEGVAAKFEVDANWQEGHHLWITNFGPAGTGHDPATRAAIKSRVEQAAKEAPRWPETQTWTREWQSLLKISHAVDEVLADIRSRVALSGKCPECG